MYDVDNYLEVMEMKERKDRKEAEEVFKKVRIFST